MIFMITFAGIFGLLMAASWLVKFRKANNVIEGANYELERAREERATYDHQQFAGHPNGYWRRGYYYHSLVGDPSYD